MLKPGAFWQYNPETLKEICSPELKEGFIKGRVPYELWDEEKKAKWKKACENNPTVKDLPEDKYNEWYNKCKQNAWIKERVKITNGKIEKMVKQGEDMPEGFYPGTCTQISKEGLERRRQARIGYHWYTNGLINLYIKEENPPEGYRPGYIKGLKYLWRK